MKKMLNMKWAITFMKEKNLCRPTRIFYVLFEYAFHKL